MPPQHHPGSFPPPLTPQSSYTGAGPTAHMNQYASPQQAGYGQLPSARVAHQHQAGYNAPRPIEVWHLPDPANASIPEDIRRQFQCDEHGRVLFFTAPPLVTSASEKKGPAHTAKYLAYKAKREEMLKEKRKRDTGDFGAAAEARKRAKSEEVLGANRQLDAAKKAALEKMEDLLVDATIEDYKNVYGSDWKQKIDEELVLLEKKQTEEARRMAEREKLEQEWALRDRRDLAVRGLNSSLEFTS
jgi:chromatin structure-remodeling complex subunit RSC1/2